MRSDYPQTNDLSLSKQENSPQDSRPSRRLGGPGRWTLTAAAVLLALAAPRVGGLLLSSAAVAIPAAAMALAGGVALALLAEKTDAPLRGAIPFAALATFLLPPPALVSAWMTVLGDLGAGGALLGGERPGGLLPSGFAGAALLHALMALPAAYFFASAAVRIAPRRREELALLDASPTVVLRRVTLREGAPALGAAAVLLATLVAAETTVTDLVRVRTFAEEIYTQAATGELLQPSVAGLGRLALGVAAVGVVTAGAAMRLAARVEPAFAAGGTPWRASLRHRPVWGLAVVAGVFVMSGLPLLGLAWRAGTGVVDSAEGPRRSWSAGKLVDAVSAAPRQHRREIGASLALAATVASTATPLGALAAWGMRRSPFAAAVGVGGAAALLAVPGPAVGLATIRLLNQPSEGLLAPLGELYGTWFAPWMAQTLRVAPAATLLLWPAFRSAPRSVLESARIDGAGEWTLVARFVAPLAGPSLAAAWLVAFALSLGELAATVLVVPPGTPPLAVRLWSLTHYGVEDRVAAIGLVLAAGSLLVAWGVRRLMPGRWGEQ